MRRVPSQTAYTAWPDDETRQAAEYHRIAAIAREYSLKAYPLLSDLPESSATTSLEVTEDGIGAPNQTNEDCPGNGVDTCLTDGGIRGFCTREGCTTGECAGDYECCHGCSEFAVSLLPFDSSACLPELASTQLINPPISCTCD